MSTLISKATGNLTAAGTWGVVDATSFLNAEVTVGGVVANQETVSSTSFATKTSNFTPGAITIDGIAVRQSARNASPNGTFSVRLEDNANAAVAGTTVTINVADLPFYGSGTNPFLGPLSWIFLKFAAPVTLAGATAYHCACSTSVAAQVFLSRDATAANFSRALRTTTAAAPVAGDDMLIMGELTGAGTGNNFTVTMDQTVATDYGSGSTSQAVPAVAVCFGGTLSYGVAGATNYLMRLSGHLMTYLGGTFSIGAVGAEIPRTSTAVLEFDTAADADFGLVARGGTVNIAGLSRTSGKNVVQTLLNADAAVNATTLTVVADTGWLDNDVIAVASSVRFITGEQSELGALNGNAGASSLTVDGFAGVAGGVAFAHDGTNNRVYTASDGQTFPYTMQCEVILLTRNVIVRAVGTASDGYLNFSPTAVAAMSWVNFTHMGGATATVGKRGMEIDTVSGSLSLTFAAFQDSRNATVVVGSTASVSAGTYNNVTIADVVLWNVCTTNINNVISTSTGTIGTNNSVNRWTVIRAGGAAGATSRGFTLNAANVQISDIRVSSTGSTGIGIFGTDTTNPNMATITVGPCIAHSLRGTRDGVGSAISVTRAIFTEIQSYRNPGGSWFEGQGEIVINSLKLWGNGQFGFGGGQGQVEVKGGFLANDTTYSDGTIGIWWNQLQFNYYLSNFDISPTQGILTPISGAGNAFVSSATAIGRPQVVLNNCLENSISRFSTSNWDLLQEEGYISIQRLNRTAGNHLTIVRGGLLATDTTIFKTASPSMRMTPRLLSTAVSPKLRSDGIRGRGIKVPVASGVGATLTVWVRKSAAGDGAAYNGSQPRLIMRYNASLGQNSDVVLATAAAAAGTWEQLTGSLPAPIDNGAYEVYVDCDGTAGWVNVDDWSAV